MKPGMRRFWPGVRPLLWWAALMLTTPIVFRAWPAFLGIETSMSQILRTPLGLFYAVVCAAIVSLFLIVGRGRRGVLGAVAAALTFVEMIQGGIGWERIALFLLTLGCLGLVIEAIRQNYPLFVEVRRQDVKALGGVFRAIVLWSPMVLVTYFGVLAHRALVTGAESLIYATTPVDQYCKGETEAPFPCEELKWSDFSDRREYTVGEDVSEYVRNLFDARQRLLIANIADASSLQDATFTDSKELQSALVKLSQDIVPTSILALPDVILTKEEWVARDAEVQRLTAQVLEARRRAPKKMRATGATGTGFLEPMFFSSLVEPVISNHIRSLERALNARKEAVIQSVPDAPDRQPDSLGQSLSRALSSTSTVYAATAMAGLTTSWADLLVKNTELISGRRALLTARSVTTLSRMQEKINTTIEAAMGDLVARPPDQQRLMQLKELEISHRCSLERSSQDVYVDKNLAEPVKINRASFPCETVPPVAVASQKRSLPLEDNVKRSISAWKRGWERRIEEGTREGLRRAIDHPAMAGAQANALADLVPKEIKLGRKLCKWSALTSYGNCIANYGKRKAEDAYRNARVRTGNAYTAGVSGTTLLAQITAAEQILKARQHAQDELLVAEQNLNDAVDTSAEMMRAAGSVLTILLVIVLIKSFLYVIALVFFGRKGPSAIQLDGTSQVECTTPPRIGHGTQEFPITLDPRFPLITKAVLNNQNIEGIYLPWGFTALLSRLIHRKITFNKGGAVDPAKSVFFGHDTKHFVVWTLEEGEELVFQWKNFFGATENIELRSRVSLRLSTLLLGRMVFHTAKATGGRAYLLLTTQAIGAGSAADDAVDAAPPDRFIIWHPHTRFQVQNNLNMFSILNDSYALVRIKVEGKPSGRVLVESPKKYVFPLAGTFRYVMRLGSPF